MLNIGFGGKTGVCFVTTCFRGLQKEPLLMSFWTVIHITGHPGVNELDNRLSGQIFNMSSRSQSSHPRGRVMVVGLLHLHMSTAET